MKKTLQKYPFYLLLLPLFLVLHIEKEHHGSIAYRFVYNEIAILLIAPVILYLLCYLPFRSMRKAGLAAFLLLLVFYFFGEIKDRFRINWPDSFWQSYGFLLTSIIILFGILVFFIYKNKSGLFRLTLYINITLLLSIAADVIGITFKKDELKPRDNTASQQFIPCPDCVKPDIYFLVFDSYTSSNLLDKDFHFRNDDIDSFLTRKGFKIVRYSRSNYNLTPFSISSNFNMGYLKQVDTIRRYFLKDYLPGVGEVYDNDLVPLLEKMGYEFYNHSIFNIWSHPSTINDFDIWGIRELYEQHNFVKKFNTDIGFHFPLFHRLFHDDMVDYSVKRDIHDSAAIDHILKTIQLATEKPKFVYGHIFKPHNPYTFDSAGNKIPFRYIINPEEDKGAYVQQIMYVNKLMKQIVDAVFAHPTRPAVIIIQGDHGYRFFNWREKAPEFPNFNAVYYYNRDYHLLPDSSTNINTFRVLFNTLFKQHYPLLPDQFNYMKYY